MPPSKGAAVSKRRAIGIVRVSQTRGREGESFASPVEQRERIEQACERDGLELVEVLDELDVSGGTPLERRTGLRTAIEAVESGRAQVVMAAYFDRLVRSLDVQRELVSRVEQAGGEVFAVDIGQVTHGSATKKLSGTLLGAFAEYQRDTARERSGEGQRRAVERGVPPFPTIPPGYRRGEDGRLVIQPDEARIVAGAFRLRADGATIGEVRDYLTTHGIERTWYSTQTLLKSRVVLGEIRFGKLVNPTAHEPIVEGALWLAAQGGKLRGTRPPSQRLLARQGVLRCGSCGARMVVGSQRQGKTAYILYRCPPTGDCPRRMTIGADIAEGVIAERVRTALADIEGRASVEAHVREAEQDLENAQDALGAAVRAFTGFEDVSETQKRLSELRQARDEAQARVDQLGGERAAVSVSADRDWERLSVDEQRALIRATVERATVSPGRGADRIAVKLFV
jgi:site-specific DNA recombinase